MLTAIIFLLVLAVLIFVHELGHFLFARWNGIRVDEFKIGFGPRILSWGKKETKYGLNLIPFGGYVKIHGENPDEESISGSDKDRSFVNKKGWQQIMVLVAGVLFNFIFAWVLYIIVFISGVTADPQGFERYSSDFKNERVMITLVSPGSPAEKAGLKVGDVIGDIKGSNGESFSSMVVSDEPFSNSSITSIQDVINSSKGTPVLMTYKRANNLATTTIEPIAGIVKDKYAIGIAMSGVVDIKLSFFSAIYEGAHYTLIMIRDTAVGLYNFIANIFKGDANFSDVSGPIGIAGIVGGAAELGFTYLLMITALISINLGVINLIPFPALDGGRVLFVIIEGVIRRRLPPKYSNAVNAVGFVLLMILMVVVTYKDIAKMFK
ncbi:MAG: site-2 protease family protein [Candidatus Paceibacterota bacterium]|jgi:regulator of sigma E protease